jgi:hypothetical protein
VRERRPETAFAAGCPVAARAIYRKKRRAVHGVGRQLRLGRLRYRRSPRRTKRSAIRQHAHTNEKDAIELTIHRVTA